jgi:hypothetical protein
VVTAALGVTTIKHCQKKTIQKQQGNKRRDMRILYCFMFATGCARGDQFLGSTLFVTPAKQGRELQQ